MGPAQAKSITKLKLLAEGPKEQASLFVVHSTNAEFREFFSAAPILSGGYIAIRGTHHDPFWRIEGSEVVAVEDRSRATLFAIYKIDGGVKVQGQPIRSGDYVYIRGTQNDPYLAVKGNEVVAGREADASVFVIYKTNGLNTAPIDGAELKSGDYVILRGTKGDPYLKLTSVTISAPVIVPPVLKQPGVSPPTSKPPTTTPVSPPYPRIVALEISPDFIYAGQTAKMTVRLERRVPPGAAPMEVRLDWSGGDPQKAISPLTQPLRRVSIREYETEISVPVETSYWEHNPASGNPSSLVYTCTAYFGTEGNSAFARLTVNASPRR